MGFNNVTTTTDTFQPDDTFGFYTTDDEDGSTLGKLHGWFTGFRVTMLYLGINVIILSFILIMACRSGAVQAKEAKAKKKQQGQNDEYQMAQVLDKQPAVADEENEEYGVELAPSSGPQSAPSEYSDRSAASSAVSDHHKAVSSLGNVKTAKVCCSAFCTDIINRSAIYSALLVHAWDQGSDFGVIFTWFTEDNGRWRYLGWISIGIVINYRLFSAYSLRKAQRGWRDTILQVLDFQVFVDVFRSFEEVKSTDQLYWIRAMEAVLESCVEILLQFVYLNEETNPLVWLSLFGSLTSVIFALLHYTDVVFVFDMNRLAHNFCHGIWLKFKWYIAYISRFLFRLCEVTSRCMVLALMWSTWNHSSDQYRGAFIVGGIMGAELVFYLLLTQLRIPPWEVVAFLVVNIDLTLTFEGRAGALTKPLRRNPFYLCICKPVAEMFTHVSDETEDYYHHRNQTDHNRFNWKGEEPKRNKEKPKRQKLLIAPAHYVYRFLESVFELFCVLTYAVLYPEIEEFVFATNAWTIVVATLTTVLTPILYCTVRAFADESKTLERNLIAMVHHGGETHEIIQLIKSGASLTQTDYEGNDIVHACVMKKNPELLRAIMKKLDRQKEKHKRHTLTIERRNKRGYTPVLLAAKCGAVDCLKLFAKQDEIDFNQRLPYPGFDPDASVVPPGPSLIHIATQHDCQETIEYLSSLGDRCSIHNKYTYITEGGVELEGYNAIHVAARFNSVKAIDILLAQKVDFGARLGNHDTAAIIAASRGHTVILQKLFDAGDIFDKQGNLGHTPLYRAALNSHPGTVLVLGRDFAADHNIPDAHGVHVVIQCFKKRIFNVLSSLAELGCVFDAIGVSEYLEIESDDKLTPLMWACKHNYPQLVKTLLDSGADVNYRNKLDETAAHHAAAMGSLDSLNLLHNFGANMFLTNGAAQTPKDKAIEQHHKLIVEWFDAIKP
eukprot:107982_1